MEPMYPTRDKHIWSVSPLTDVSGRASPAGLSAEASSTKEPYQNGEEQQNPHSFNTFP